MGASDAHLQTIYDQGSKELRPIDVNNTEKTANPPTIEISERNWTLFLERQGYVSLSSSYALSNVLIIMGFRAYQAYLKFFTHEISAHGVKYTLKKYIFTPEATAKDVCILTRFVSGA
jgi:hypothetical protein